MKKIQMMVTIIAGFILTFALALHGHGLLTDIILYSIIVLPSSIIAASGITQFIQERFFLKEKAKA